MTGQKEQVPPFLVSETKCARQRGEIGVMTSDHGAARLRAELDRVQRLGIESVPVFYFDDGSVLDGEQAEETLLAALDTLTT
ncbi:hypothetical protein EF847_00180 [Actinobacteria bacterium YIM 96077]|uniref:DSBA-like thioredoxin domain-containing protein n=2 Tax=Phytoactinopolyspora halophila TaxID=1981511 RepID=A0A329QQP1_9ACTN|nr:hypothetical protein EF847_00180 [Actinobacteria bacterium YIM 96077]RAW14680.1 hypothetical protein DPM12_10490 [Phytoactinopolyspora halophila]